MKFLLSTLAATVLGVFGAYSGAVADEPATRGDESEAAGGCPAGSDRTCPPCVPAD